MCRFVVYHGPAILLADLVTEPTHSLIHQSYQSREREEPLNGDGFGVAWYAPEFGEEPAVFRDITPAWNNENLRNLARVTRSGTILAHVRAATQGLSVIQTNCHPFSSGRYAFMHNGDLTGFAAIRRKFLSLLSDRAFMGIRGTTDSEHMFALFLDRLAEQTHAESVDRMAAALEAALRQASELVGDQEEASTLNIVVADGEHVVASRCVFGHPSEANTLYWRRGRQYRCENGVCSMDDAMAVETVMIASEPLFDHGGWSPVPPNHTIVVGHNLQTEIRPLWLARKTVG